MAVDRGSSRSLNQLVALGFGVVYTLVGLAGFLVSDTFAASEDDALLGFQVNHLHNIVHLVIGLALIAAASKLGTARSANLSIGVVYVALGLFGPLIVGTDLNVLALNTADHFLHLVSGAALALVALAADRRSRSRV